MRILVLGGTAWLGRSVASEALARRHEVTCLARGNGEVAAGASLVRADRDQGGAYADVLAQRWDAVVDVARQPGHVRSAVAALEPLTRRYVFVSTGNVYASHLELDQDEDAALLPPLGSDEMPSMKQYGEAKVACEQAVLDTFGAGRTVIARAGLIGGPGDESGRSGYWPHRFAHPDGPVLVPDEDQQIELIDVRDLATWLVGCIERGASGIFNAVANRMSLAEHLAVAREVAGHDGPVASASAHWLHEQGVQPWSGARSLPLWIGDPDWAGFAARSNRRAVEAGLRTRPLRETLADVLAWEEQRTGTWPHGAGLTDKEQRDLVRT